VGKAFRPVKKPKDDRVGVSVLLFRSCLKHGEWILNFMYLKWEMVKKS
jgi:hypothetical protein